MSVFCVTYTYRSLGLPCGPVWRCQRPTAVQESTPNSVSAQPYRREALASGRAAQPFYLSEVDDSVEPAKKSWWKMRAAWVEMPSQHTSRERVERRGSCELLSGGSCGKGRQRPPLGRLCSNNARANVDFGDEGAVDWTFLGNFKELRALVFG